MRGSQPTSLFKSFKNPRNGSRGSVWLDAKDGRVRRWIDDTLVVDDEIETPAVLIHKDIAYRSSALGVFPARIAIETFDNHRDQWTIKRMTDSGLTNGLRLVVDAIAVLCTDCFQLARKFTLEVAARLHVLGPRCRLV